jgi:acetyl-CoA synthetase
MLMRAGAELPARHDLSRCASSPASASRSTPRRWLGPGGLGLPDPRQLVADRDRRDHDRQLPGDADVRPGSMGRPLPGIEAAILRPRARRRAASSTATGAWGRPTSPTEEGELALRPGWPSMFRGYLHEPERYARCFAGGWYLTGDLARATPTATSGSSAAPTTSSSPPGT